jgi:YVTN family beta-propeller protein
MKLDLFGLLATAVVAVSCLLGSAQTLAQNAYITVPGENEISNTVSVVDTRTNMVSATIPVGVVPSGSR